MLLYAGSSTNRCAQRFCPLLSRRQASPEPLNAADPAGRGYTPPATLRGVPYLAVGGPPRSSGRCGGRVRDLIIARLLQGLLVIVGVVVVVFLVVRVIPGDPVRLMGRWHRVTRSQNSHSPKYSRLV